MKIAVITPYYKEPIEFLQKCHESVINQNVCADHFMVADGYPNEKLSELSIKHIRLPYPHFDNGNTPRGLGGALAIAEGYDFIAYLDADNWYQSGHLPSLIKLHSETNFDVCASFRTFYSLNGQELVGVEDHDEKNLTHVDTSCYLIHSNAFSLNSIWLKMPAVLGPICDRVFLSGIINRGYRIASTRTKTVAFRSQYKSHYQAANVVPPRNTKDDVGKECIEYLQTVEGIRDTVRRLGYFPL